MSTARTPPGIWTGQWLHLSGAVLLLALVWFSWAFLGEPFPVIFWSAVAFPLAHQIFVWLAWRFELRSSAISKSIGFAGYLVIFFLLFGGRFITLATLGWLDRGSLELPPIPQVILAAILILVGTYAMVSVRRYFGMARAAGADHFDPRYRDMPLVRQGIFRFTRNGMYVYAFFWFWALAIVFNSAAALLIAAFSHAHIWLHFYGTEKPDMDYLYGSDSKL